ncbi:hypothetical protein FA95DRAFT_1557344 [Auriscalpium vulgare]|uniref:Uncharacterized protein n=1 Tax=Auriscalpium vulgare TaxID=40419 RepID=A0ACB8RZT5_9AGAM|nr:hypothetical protein FA95DRAFT_1557344 [Auriscalpium vulgare]
MSVIVMDSTRQTYGPFPPRLQDTSQSSAAPTMRPATFPSPSYLHHPAQPSHPQHVSYPAGLPPPAYPPVNPVFASQPVSGPTNPYFIFPERPPPIPPIPRVLGLARHLRQSLGHEPRPPPEHVPPLPQARYDVQEVRQRASESRSAPPVHEQRAPQPSGRSRAHRTFIPERPQPQPIPLPTPSPPHSTTRTPHILYRSHRMGSLRFCDAEGLDGWLTPEYPCHFRTTLYVARDSSEPPHGVTTEFTSVTQYMHARKALLSNDVAAFRLIVGFAAPPRNLRALENQVLHHDERVWAQEKYGIAVEGCRLKFEQNPELRRRLRRVRENELIYCDPADSDWGIGYDVENVPIDRSLWGRNLLGKALEEVQNGLIHPRP